MIRSWLLHCIKRLKIMGKWIESELEGEKPSSNIDLESYLGYDSYLKEEKGRVLICYHPNALRLPPNSPQM